MIAIMIAHQLVFVSPVREAEKDSARPFFRIDNIAIIDFSPERTNEKRLKMNVSDEIILFFF